MTYYSAHLWSLLAGSIWVYGLLGKYTTSDPSMPDHCDPDLYIFTFAVVTVYWVWVPGTLIVMGCMWCWLAIILTCCCGVNTNVAMRIKGTMFTLTW